ncbi:hypothetical protein LX87_04734 [Larkinella arboricola]|uniref:Uncharacterized protein n=1 Tax=Larkinella arboricola TaxID=643671 RepID=A0A327WQV0_LARAB|nr:hypothetical protein [Larkinella arboricola]RAJ93222.1 hypothetical protein LX87_04734 [Larkinella arboricola]
MKVVRELYGDWDAVYCYGKDCLLIVGISRGPRILYYSKLNGSNLLYEDNTNFGLGNWRLYGGHRLTTAPESEESYIPDNEPCTVFTGQGFLKVEAPINKSQGIIKSIKIYFDDLYSGFLIEHRLFNKNITIWEGALWAITCVPAVGTIYSTVDAGDEVHLNSEPVKD